MPITTTFVLSTFAVFNYRTERDRQIRELRNEQSVLVDQLAVSLALPVWNFDRAQIDKVIESAMRDEDVSGAVVKLADVNSTIQARVRNRRWEIQTTNKEPSANGLFVESRNIVADDETLGTVELLVTPQFYRAGLKKTLASMIINIALFDAILVALLYLLFWRLVIQPTTT